MLLLRKMVLGCWLGCLGSGLLWGASVREVEFPLEVESRGRLEGVVEGEMLRFEWKDSRVFPGTEREVRVYVPRAYDGKTAACVAVFQDGGGYKFEVVFDNLIRSGEMPVTIGVVVPPGKVRGVIDETGVRNNRTFEYDSPGDRYSRFLLEEILPEVEKLRTADGRAIVLSKRGSDRMIAGNSSGGAAAFNAAWAMPEEFSRVFTSVGSYTGLRGSFVYPTLVHKTEPKAIRVFLQSGTGDMWTSFGDWWSANNAMVRALEFAGYEFEYAFGEGRHSMAHGTAVFPDAMRFLWKGWPEAVRAGTKSRNHALKNSVWLERKWEVVAEQLPGARIIRAEKSGRLSATGELKHFILGADGKWGRSSPHTLLGFGKSGMSLMTTTGPYRAWVLSADEITYSAVGGKIFIGNVTLTSEEKAKAGKESFGWGTRSLSEMLSKSKPLPSVVGLGGEISALAITGDGNWLAAFERDTTRGWSWRIEKDGGLSCGQSFYVLHKLDEDDGAGALDAAAEASELGYIYVATALGMQVCDANGRTAAILPLPRGVAAVSLCFGGKDFKTLYVLGTDGVIYARAMKNRGAVPWLPPVGIRMGVG